MMVYEVGDIVKLKKPHPCGSQEWEILRVGADFRLKCMGCGHMVKVPETGRDGSEVNGDWKRNTKTAGIPDHKK